MSTKLRDLEQLAPLGPQIFFFYVLGRLAAPNLFTLGTFAHLEIWGEILRIKKAVDPHH